MLRRTGGRPGTRPIRCSGQRLTGARHWLVSPHTRGAHPTSLAVTRAELRPHLSAVASRPSGRHCGGRSARRPAPPPAAVTWLAGASDHVTEPAAAAPGCLQRPDTSQGQAQCMTLAAGSARHGLSRARPAPTVPAARRRMLMSPEPVSEVEPRRDAGGASAVTGSVRPAAAAALTRY